MKRSHKSAVSEAWTLIIMIGITFSQSDLASAQASRSDKKIAKGSYFSVESFPLPNYLNGFINIMTPIDFDNDGDLDMVLLEMIIPTYPAPFGNGLLVALRNDGNARFTDVTSAVFKRDSAVNVLCMIVSDFNHDGRQDLFVPDWGNDWDPCLGAQNQIFIQTPQGRLANETSSRLPAVLDMTGGATAGDIDGDGDLDIYSPAFRPLPRPPYFLINNGKGYFAAKNDNLPPDMVTFPLSSCPQGLLLDVDRDRDLDLVLGSGFPETDRLLINDGKGYFSDAPDNAMPLRYGGKAWFSDQIISADFNKDGWSDLVMHTGKHGAADVRFQLLLNNCNGTFRDATHNIPFIDSHDWIRVPIDLNQDGWIDLLVSDYTGPRLLLNRGNAKFVEMRDMLLSLPKDRIVDLSYPCDLDQDGDIDIFGVSNPPDGIGRVFRQLKPFVFSTKVLFPALLQSPARNAVDLPTSLTLRWTDQNKKPYPDEALYQVRIRLEGGTYKYFNVKKGRTYLRIIGLVAGTIYSWNVKAIGNGKDIKDSEWAVSSNDWTFTTK